MESASSPVTEPRQIVIFDTTLRDGEQSPGCAMNLPEKMEVAHALDALGVDVIEAGFPIASPGDHQAVTEIAKSVRRPIICGLARCRDKDIDRAWDALQHAERPRIHVFLATSAIHREHKLGKSKEEILSQGVTGVKRARNLCPDVEYSPEDASRTEIDFLCQMVEQAIDAGATTVNIPDTVGYATPEHMAWVMTQLKNRVPNIDRAIVSVHCHNDLGLATANSLAAVQAGAGQVECTVNGIGERAGNAPLEEVVMAMRIHEQQYRTWTRIQSDLLVPTSRTVAQYSNPPQRHKPIVGKNAFAHSAGIHQDGMNKNEGTYQIMTAESVGWTEYTLPITKHSGKSGVEAHLRAANISIDPADLDPFTARVKAYAEDRGQCPSKEVDDDHLIALLADYVMERTGGPFIPGEVIRPDERKEGRKFVKFQASTGAAMEGIAENEKEGAINGFVCGLKVVWKELTGEDIEVEEPGIESHSKGGQRGSDVPLVATIKLRSNGLAVIGTGEHVDSEKSGIFAVQNAVNRLWALRTNQRASGRDGKRVE
ncbi:MAG: 2-isopropylmalate synthase [Candidatus Peribacter sp.]|nr:2-isopropylmalate synthase [Candidatus Peribacter sp.]